MATVEGVLNFPMTDETHPRRRPTAEEVPASDGDEGSDVALEQSSRPDPVQSVVLVPFQLVFEGEGRNRRAAGCFFAVDTIGAGCFGRIWPWVARATLCATALLLAHLVRGLWI